MSENKSKPTPGPWYWDCGLVPPDGPHRYADIYDDNETVIAEFNEQIPEGIANARLIAAAPETKAQRDELLAALTAIGVLPDGYCFCFGHYRHSGKPKYAHTGECQAARATIRRAQGGGDE